MAHLDLITMKDPLIGAAAAYGVSKVLFKSTDTMSLILSALTAGGVFYYEKKLSEKAPPQLAPNLHDPYVRTETTQQQISSLPLPSKVSISNALNPDAPDQDVPIDHPVIDFPQSVSTVPIVYNGSHGGSGDHHLFDIPDAKYFKNRKLQKTKGTLVY